MSDAVERVVVHIRMPEATQTLMFLRRLLEVDPGSDEARRRRCPYCDPSYWERHADDCPYVAAKAFVEGLEAKP